MPPSSKVSIGAALLGDVKLADGFSAAQEQMPEAWLSLLAQQHPDILPELLASCDSGREVALQTAASLRLSVDCCAAPDKTTSVWLRRLDGMRQALVTRGRQKTSLSIQCKPLYYPGFDAQGQVLKRLGLIPAYIAGWKLRELQVDASPRINIGPQLDRLLTHTPNLVTLNLTTYPYPLPPPSSLPRLRELGAKVNGGLPERRQEAFRSISKYMPQLTTLHLDNCDSWGVVFNAANPATKLTRFSTERLVDGLVLALSKHAPAVTQVEATYVFLEQSHRDKEWGVDELTVGCTARPGQEHVLWERFHKPFLCKLALLPKRADGPLTVKGRKDAHLILDDLGSEEVQSVLTLLPDWRLDFHAIEIRPTPRLQREAQGPLLDTILSKLQLMQTAQDVPVRLALWDWTEPMAFAVREAMPTLGHLALGVRVPLTDKLLGLVLHMGPLMRHVWADKIDLEYNTYSNTPWTWEALHGHHVEIDALTKLPKPGPANPAVIRCRGVCVDADATRDEVATAELLDRLKHVTFTNRLGYRQHEGSPSMDNSAYRRLYRQAYTDGHPSIEVLVKCFHARNETEKDLITQLPILHALRIKAPQPVHFTIESLRLNTKTVPALQGFPSWPCCLLLHYCEWPSQACRYKQLGAALPTRFTFVELGAKVKAKHVRSFCEGIAETRARVERAAGVTVYCEGHEGEGVQVGEHVWMTASEKMRRQCLYGL